MVSMILTGIAAGLASALLFVSVTTGSALSILLFYIAPLPVMIAALGWSHRAGLIAALVAGTGLAIVGSPMLGVVYLVSVALPAWLLAYLALLARSDGGTLSEWFPIGTIVLIAAALGGLLANAAMLSLGLSVEAIEGQLRSALTEMTTPPGATAPEELINILVVLLPPLAAMMWVITTLFNLWLAGKIVLRSSRLPRPWPVLRELRLPKIAVPALIVATLGGFVPGILGFSSELFAATFITAFALLGFAVLHDVTFGQSARPLILSAVYLLCFIMGWALLLVAMFGIADHFLDLRSRFAARRGPPSNPL